MKKKVGIADEKKVSKAIEENKQKVKINNSCMIYVCSQK